MRQVLPVNMLNEKFYLILWFWFAFLFLVCCSCSLLT